MGKKVPQSHVAYCEEVDENDEPISNGEQQYARSMVPDSPTTKEKPNTGRSRQGSRRSTPVSPVTPVLTDSDSSTHRSSSKRESKSKPKEERRRSRTVVLSDKRPPVRSAKTTPAPSSRASDDSSYYGVPSHTLAPASSRPRAHTRPQSYYGQNPRAQHPPLSSSAYYYQPPPASSLPPPSFPPPSYGAPMAFPMHQAPMPSPSAASDYFNRDLSSRFQRPQSALGHRQYSAPHDYEQAPEQSLVRKSSVSKRSGKEHDDRRKMPPPPRPKSTRPERTKEKDRTSERVTFRPPQPSSMRKSVVFDDEDLEGDGALYQPTSYRRSVEYGSVALPIRTRGTSRQRDPFYDGGSYETEPRSRNRRNSAVNMEDKIRHAARYQDDVGGGTTALTVEALQRVKNVGSSSSRSAASRDESDYKHSATTRTTRSSSGDDDITIKVPMGAVVEVGGAKIRCDNGGTMSVGRGDSSRAGSDRDRESLAYGDDRRSRADRSTATRTRASSTARSYPKALAPPLYSHAPYVHHAPYSPYYEGEPF